MKKLGLLFAAGMMSVVMLTGCGGGSDAPATTAVTTAAPADSSTQAGYIELPATIVNNYPDTTIHELYMSGEGLNNWGEDLLGNETMSTGQQLSLVLNVDINNLKWDIKAVDEAGTEVEFRGLDLSNVSTSGCTITLEAGADGTPVVTAR